MEKKIKPPSDNHLLALGTDNRVEKLATVRHFVFIMYKLYDIVYSLYLRQDDAYISSVLASLDQRLASLDENNVVENETFDKKNAFTKKPLLAQSPESREDMIKAEEWLQALAESVKEYAEEIKKEAEEKKTKKTDEEKGNGAAGLVILLFVLWGFCGDHGGRRRNNAYYDQYY